MSEGGMVLYIDEQVALMLANGLLDYLLLWATAAITHTSTGRQRLLGGAALGTLYYLLYALSVYNVVPFYGTLCNPLTVLAVSIVMLMIVFAPVARGRFWSVLSHFYVISFISAGSGLAGAHLFSSEGEMNPFAGVIVAVLTLLLTAHLGWGVLQRRSWRQGQQLPIEITFGGSVTRVIALLDTGNRLRDPISGTPAVVVEHQALAKLFSPNLTHALERMEAGDLQEIASLEAATGWSSRFRIVPFTSVGTTNGLMVGFRPDTVTIWLGGTPHSLQGCVVALAPHSLDPARMYQALIGPELVENAVLGGDAHAITNAEISLIDKTPYSTHDATYRAPVHADLLCGIKRGATSPFIR